MITIGITDCSKWKNYCDWFSSDEVNVIKLSPKENNVADVERCDGIVLSGGEDVHPKYYGKPSYWKKRKKLKLEVNEARDEFELKVIDKAVKDKKPILGICRGLQIANVYFKGTLIPDLASHLDPLFSRRGEKGKGVVRDEAVRHSKNEGYDQMHFVNVKPDTCLSAIINNEKGEINSAHHQSADKIGKGLTVTAKAKDGTVEAIEWKNPKDKSFFLLVQWHPERMKEKESAFAKNLKEKFLEEAKKAAL